MAAIKKITLDNFKSFRHIDFDLSSGNRTLPYAFIYGENGSGKSNLIHSIGFLKRIIFTLGREPESVEKENEFFDTFGRLINMMQHDSEFDKIKNSIRDIMVPKDAMMLAQEYRMIGSDENMSFRIVLDMGGYDATYSIVFDKDNMIISESLKSLVTKRTNDLFILNYENGKIFADYSPALFTDSGYSKNFKELIRQYWGKHSLLSILNYEMMRNNEQFLRSSLAGGLLDFIESVKDICVDDDYLGEVLKKANDLKYNPLSGSIRTESIWKMKNYENALNKAFTRMYSDVKKVYFKIRDEKEGWSTYSLFFTRHIHGKDRDIPASEESSGTGKLLDILPYLMDCASGKTVLIDEMDSGIHDKLVFDLITEILGEIRGQLIITTHNTSLLKILDPKNAFIISTDLDGERTIYSIASIMRTQKNNNNQDRYLRGLMDGVPYMGEIDLDEITDSFEEELRRVK